ncbi:hypothetical protein D918_10168 [Trichuris suis]|nr:hypothetical protein D918_10168 [Trichuris suis]
MALSESDLQYFDAICQELLQATDNEKRYAADKALSEFCKRPEVFANIHPLLERTDVYGRVFLAAALKVVISRSGVVPVEQRLQLLGFLLNYLFSRQCAERLVLKSLIDLFCKLVKVSSFNYDSEGEMQFQIAVKRVIELNEGSMESCSIAVELLRSLVVEMGQYFDAICQELLQATDNEKRYAADKALSEFCKRPEVFANIHPLLERTDVYGRVFLAAALKVVISRSGVVPMEQRLQLLGFLLNYLFSRQCAERLVLKSLIDLFCKLVKVSSFNYDSEGEMQFQIAVKRVIELNEGSMESCSIAVELLRSLVVEMGQLDQSCLIGRQLKVAASFRDTYLLDIYKVSIGLLKSVAENVISFNVEDADQRSLLVGVLALSLACLSFEFANSRGTEERDESIVVLIPSSWRDVFFSFDVIKLYHTIYMHLPVVEELALNCLVQVASIRRTLFDCKKRSEMLLEMMESIIEMLSSSRVPSAPESSHQFCLLLVA